MRTIRPPWLVLGFVIACNSGSATPSPTPSAPSSPAAPAMTPATPAIDLAGGEQLYMQLCAACHGKDAKGYAADHAPSLINPTFLESATDEFLRRSIIMGRPGTSMAGYGKPRGGPLTDQAVDNIVGYLRSLGPAAKALPPVVLGDPAIGAKVYAASCKSCHGDVATRGEAVHLANAQFLQHASDAFIHHAVVFGRPGTKMEAFASKLTPAQLVDVVAFVRGFAATAPKAAMLAAPTGKEPLVINPKAKDAALTIRDHRFVSVDHVNRELAAKRRMVIIDARPPSEWMRAHIKGAVSIPYHDMKRLAEIPKDVPAIAYCACPHHLSGIVVDELIKLGHKKAYVLDEGVNEWHRRGYPMTVAEGVTAPAMEAPHGHSHDGHDHGHGHAH
ncbi:MAG: c-type cytochrome [Kofleriaceae bacterium]